MELRHRYWRSRWGDRLTPNPSATSLLVRIRSVYPTAVVTPLATVMEELNRRFQMSTQGDLYFTMSLLRVGPRKGRAAVCLGRPPADVLVRDGKASFLPNTNFPVGWIDDVEYEAATITLYPPAIACFYTPMACQKQPWRKSIYSMAMSGCWPALQAESGLSLGDHVDRLFKSVTSWCHPQSPTDDVSILGCEFARSQSAE